MAPRLLIRSLASIAVAAVPLGTAWAATPPVLASGVWTDISPHGPHFAGEPKDGAFTQGVAVDPADPRTIYLCTDSFQPPAAGLYKTTDGGATWTTVGNLDEPVRVRVDPKRPQHLYCGDGVRGKTMGFWISEDGGATWAKPASWTEIARANHIYIDDVYDIAVDPADFAHLLVASHSPWSWDPAALPLHHKNAGILESVDGGATWILHEPQDGWGQGHDIWFLGDRRTWLLGTQGAGYWRTADAGATWTQVSKENMAHGGGQLYRSTAASDSVPGVLYVSCASGKGVLRSVDDGLTWSEVAAARFTTAVFGDGATLYTHSAYAIGNAPFVISPELDGVTWKPQPGGQIFSNGPFEMAMDRVNGIVYAANWASGLWAYKIPDFVPPAVGAPKP